jgi:hypothetical protein
MAHPCSISNRYSTTLSANADRSANANVHRDAVRRIVA